MNQLHKLFSSAAICFALILSVNPARADFYLRSWVFDAAGGSAASTGYGNFTAAAQSSPLGAAASSGYRNYPGFIHGVAAQGHLLPDYTVSLSFAGSGTGRVTSFPAGIQCNFDCSAPFNAYFPVTLTPAADQFMVFSGWSGGCTGTAPCSMTLTGNSLVTAAFDKDVTHSVYVPGILPGLGIYYSTLQTAYDAALGGFTVNAWATTYPEDLTCGLNKSIVLKGGYDQGYLTQTGYTTLDGVLTIGQGVVTIERLTVK